MKHQTLSLGPVIAAAASITVIYLMSILLEMRLAIILALYVSAAVSTLWMAFRILKDPYSTEKTFDEYFYQDRDDLRRCGPE